MNPTRRGFLAGMLAAAAAPAIVRAESLMKLPSAPKLLHTYWDGSNWRVDAGWTTGEQQGVAMGNLRALGQAIGDRWYTPPERVINARPFVYAGDDDWVKCDALRDAVDRGVEDLRILAHDGQSWSASSISAREQERMKQFRENMSRSLGVSERLLGETSDALYRAASKPSGWPAIEKLGLKRRV